MAITIIIAIITILINKINISITLAAYTASSQ
jgi:hypothetical protein